jgi:hypothetical protein
MQVNKIKSDDPMRWDSGQEQLTRLPASGTLGSVHEFPCASHFVHLQHVSLIDIGTNPPAEHK